MSSARTAALEPKFIGMLASITRSNVLVFLRFLEKPLTRAGFVERDRKRKEERREEERMVKGERL